MSYRVLLADDHPVTRLGLRSVLDAAAGLTIVGEARDGPSALAKCLELLPDVAVLDFWLPGLNALQVIEGLRARDCTARVLVVSGQGTVEVARLTKRAGGMGFLSKDVEPGTLARAVFEVAAGRSVWTSAQRHAFSEQEARPALSARELQVLQELATGKSNKEIAAVLGLSDGTVRIHLSNIFGKLEVDDRTTAVTLALKQGLISL